MALQSSGPISLSDINVELDFLSTAPISLGDAAVRGLLEVPTGAISISDAYGKSNLFTFTISANTTNANLRSLAVLAGWDQATALQATISAGVIVSSNGTGTPGMVVSGSFPAGVSLVNDGVIVGDGGNGGKGGDNSASNGAVGGGGGVALSVSSALTVTNNGTIAAGGGGGGGGGRGREIIQTSNDLPYTYSIRYFGGGGGGGGRTGLTNSAGGSGGTNVYNPNAYYLGKAGGAGTYSSPGNGAAAYRNGGAGGNGGAWGSNGGSGGNSIGGGGGVGSGGGAGGSAVSGNVNITWLATGSRFGAIV